MLRERLQQMTVDRDVSKHAMHLAEISLEIPNSIVIRECLDRCNCIEYAFGFAGRPDYLKIATFGLGKRYANKAFVNWLLAREFLTELQSSSVGTNALITYFQNGAFQHVGVVIDGERVISKWGEGLLYEHFALEVPSSYGDELRYFARPGGQYLWRCFNQYLIESERNAAF